MKTNPFIKKFPVMAILGSMAFSVPSFAENVFYFNEAGYDSDQPISIVVRSTDNLEGQKWTLWFDPDGGMTGASVATGTFGAGLNPDNWTNNGKYYAIALTEKPTQSGNFHVEVAAGSPSSSGKFFIGDKALAQKTLSMVLDYFYDDRADKAPVVDWDKSMSVYKSDKKLDVHGGWYDASGDVSKYLSHLSYANYLNPQQIPLTVWTLAFAAERIPTLLGSTSSKAKTSAEAAYGADFLVRMLDEQGFFYMTVFDKWGNPLDKRELCAFTGSDGVKSTDYQTAFREGGGMAIAGLARVSKLGVKGDFTSEQYLAAAEKGYAHLSQKQSIGGNCEYCDDHKENIIDDYTALLAATELFAATKKKEYRMDARARAENLYRRLSNDGYFWSDDAKTRPFWHASDAGLPLIALVRFAELESSVTIEDDDYDLSIWGCPDCLGCSCVNQTLQMVLGAIRKHCNWLVSITNKVDNPFGYARQTYKTQNAIKDGFFIPHDNESNYWWQGEDARIASLAAASVYAARGLGILDSSVKKYAADQLDWILGKNPYATCMMYGIGKKNPAKYDGQSEYDATLKGGIANGITGKNNDGSGIAWTDDGVAAVGFDAMKESWQVWRWDEQWLPHTTWFLMALATRYDEKAESIQPPASIKRSAVAASGFGVAVVGRTLSVSLNGVPERVLRNTSIRVVDLDGREVVTNNITGRTTMFELPRSTKGVFMVQVPGVGVKKVVVR